MKSGASFAANRRWPQPFPEFLLPDQDGWLKWWRELLAQGPFVISFFHGGWCETCVARLRHLESRRHRLHAMGISLSLRRPIPENPLAV